MKFNNIILNNAHQEFEQHDFLVESVRAGQSIHAHLVDVDKHMIMIDVGLLNIGDDTYYAVSVRKIGVESRFPNLKMESSIQHFEFVDAFRVGYEIRNIIEKALQ